jgi:hypothetical protein
MDSAQQSAVRGLDMSRERAFVVVMSRALDGPRQNAQRRLQRGENIACYAWPMNAPILLTRYRQHRSLTLLAREDVSSYASAGETAQAVPPKLEPETAVDWILVHERIVTLGKERALHEREVCRWLCCAERLGVHARAGYASVREYAERTLGLDGRQTEERLRVGRALACLPALDGALAAGALCWSAVRELSRIATVETELAWLAFAKGRSMREVEKAVAARHPGDGPKAPVDPSIVKHRLRFEVRAETMALFRDLQARVRADLSFGGQIDDDTLLFEIARRALGGPDDEGRASYQVAVSRCDACGLASIDSGAHSERVDEAVAEMLDCDSQQLGQVDGRNEATGPHVGASTARATRPRATQTIPPAIRRQVMRRDRKRCVVPGCANHRFLDVHHLDLRCEGGGHDPDRMAVFCGSHHRAVHAGRLWIDGTATQGFVVRHAGGAAYGAPLGAPALVEGVAEVQSALEKLGFKPTRARALIEAAVRAGAPHDAHALLREALRAS